MKAFLLGTIVLLIGVGTANAQKRDKFDPANFPLSAEVIASEIRQIHNGTVEQSTNPACDGNWDEPFCAGWAATAGKRRLVTQYRQVVVIMAEIDGKIYVLEGEKMLEPDHYHARRTKHGIEFLTYSHDAKRQPRIERYSVVSISKKAATEGTVE